jgi:hypothetical protein
MTVNKMLDEMPSTEIVEWQAFFRLESKERGNNRQQQTMINKLAGKKGRRSRR